MRGGDAYTLQRTAPSAISDEWPHAGFIVYIPDCTEIHGRVEEVLQLWINQDLATFHIVFTNFTLYLPYSCKVLRQNAFYMKFKLVFPCRWEEGMHTHYSAQHTAQHTAYPARRYLSQMAEGEKVLAGSGGGYKCLPHIQGGQGQICPRFFGNFS